MVVGRSNIVGRPVSILTSLKNKLAMQPQQSVIQAHLISLNLLKWLM